MDMIKFLVGNRIRFETRPTKDRCVFCWKTLVDFELQAYLDWGGHATAGVDIFRFDADGKVVEHWDVLQPVPASSDNANTMF